MCKKDPSLVDRLSQKPSTTEVDEELLDGVWRHSLVSLRLMMFQVRAPVIQPRSKTHESTADPLPFVLIPRTGGVLAPRGPSGRHDSRADERHLRSLVWKARGSCHAQVQSLCQGGPTPDTRLIHQLPHWFPLTAHVHIFTLVAVISAPC